MTKQYSLKYNNLLKHVGRVGWKETIRAQGKNRGKPNSFGNSLIKSLTSLRENLKNAD